MDVIEALYAEHEELRQFLSDAGELTFVAEIERTYPKVLLIAAASLFETEVVAVLSDLFAARSGNDELTLAFIRSKGFDRQYHTYFAWKDGNANAFWSLFGADFKTYAVARLRGDETLTESARHFIELGHLRNQLVHGNYLLFALEKTAEEVIALARSAFRFVEALPSVLRDYGGPEADVPDA